MKSSQFQPEKRKLMIVAIVGLIAATVLISSFLRSAENSFFCSLAESRARDISDYSATPIQLHAIFHYATSKTVPQQTRAEITVSFNVLKDKAPLNFLVFGLGYDSMMWNSLNPHGNTLFLEEDPKWVQHVLKDAPTLKAHAVQYRTQLFEADHLLSTYKSEPNCRASKAYIRGNIECKLALTGLPDEVYDIEWDMIMIDAPRGYFREAPGRMGAIFSAAVMARQRKGSGVTHVFLHDVDRRVEKVFAKEFLCRKYLKHSVGRLWHFEIPSVANSSDVADNDSFC